MRPGHGMQGASVLINTTTQPHAQDARRNSRAFPTGVCGSGFVESSFDAAAMERTVRVSGSVFLPAQRYTVRLEGAEHVGHQSVLT